MDLDNKKYSLNYKKAFTLVELIVVITILAILWTVAFISFSNYTTSARDWTRISDIKNMWFALSNHYNKMGSYPLPSNYTWITYSGGILFYHWSFGSSVVTSVREISKLPLDPLFDVEYNYATTAQKNVYQLWYIQEWQDLTYNLFNKANAADSFREMIWKTSWNFNWLLVGWNTWWLVYVVSVPSIILTDIPSNEVTMLVDKFVYNDELNLPQNYKNSWISQVWNFSFEPKVVYTWTTLPSSPSLLKPLIVNVQSALHNIDHPTTLFSHPDYQYILELDSDNPDELYNFWTKYINKDLWWRFVLKYSKSCKAMLWTSEDKGDWNYTISPDWLKKLNVYCDMTTDWWWWTRVRRRERWVWYTEWSDINKTRGLEWTELMAKYTRYGNIRVFSWWLWQDYDVSWKTYWVYYKRFKTKQWDFNWLCGEHTTISDLISQITWWSWGTCNRDCSRVDNLPTGACIGSLEYTDILLDDMWENIWLSGDKVGSWIYNDPCVVNWRHTWGRNISWTPNWAVQHRNDSNTSLTVLWWTDQWRCTWIPRNYTSIQTSYNNEVSPTWFWHTRFDWVSIDSRYNQWYQTNEVYIR